MPEERSLDILLKTLRPELNDGDFVFCTIDDPTSIDIDTIVGFFREAEAITVILSKETADQLQLPYSFIASWITLSVHSSLTAVGLTAAFSKALAENGISCNVVAGYYHDHLFVEKKDSIQAMKVLRALK